MSDLYLYIYDLSKGMARQFSPMFLGKQIDGVWHTGIVAFGEEWYFGNDGINSCPPKTTILGEPNEMMHLGKTELNEDQFLDVIRQMAESSYKIGSYNLLEHNCNNFSNDLAQIIVGKPIPSHIIDLPREILNTAIGPMLRPLLEKAADPISQNGEIRIPKYQINGLTKQEVERPLPSTAILFNPELTEEFKALINECENQLKLNESNLLNEINEYLQQTNKEFSISKNHIKFLFELYLVHLKEATHQDIVLKIFQTISLDKPLAESAFQNEFLVREFVPRIKNSELNLKINSLRTMSNICSHLHISKQLLEKHQELIFKELSEFILTEPNSETDLDMHEACISFFYNLIVAFELEAHLSDGNALTLGCALLERMPKLKLKPKSIYQTLALLRSCLTVSQDMKELAVSMDFDINKFHLSQQDKETFENKNNNAENNLPNVIFKTDSYDTVLNKVDTILHEKK